MRTEVPDGDIAAIIERAVAEKLERLEARRFAASAAPRKTLSDSDTSKASRHIPAAVRRAVRVRDGNRCRLLCSLHSRHLAEHDYGQSAVKGRRTMRSNHPGLPRSHEGTMWARPSALAV